MIAIKLVAHAGEALAVPLAARFGAAGGDIGRATDCTLVLPDPERRISRKHVQVTCRDGAHFARLISANLLVELDGVPMAPGVERALAPGSTINIGPFALAVTDAETVAADAASPALANDRVTRSSVFADLLRMATVERPATARADFPADVDAVDIVLGDGTGSQSRPDAGEPQAASQEREDAIDALFAALYAGMGIVAPASAPKSAAQMQLVGVLMRAAVEGALGLLAARGIAKHEFGAAHTLIQARENNPLKFAAGADDALSRLLQLPEHGFIAALPAVNETFDALRAHEVALLAAMRAALQAVVDRFDPAAIERDLADKGGVWESLLPGHHKARLWECYCEQHAELNRGIEDNLNALFAGAFNAAYEAQVERLTRKA